MTLRTFEKKLRISFTQPFSAGQNLLQFYLHFSVHACTRWYTPEGGAYVCQKEMIARLRAGHTASTSQAVELLGDWGLGMQGCRMQ